jgi:23S rRNA pseudouridine2604 synthase
MTAPAHPPAEAGTRLSKRVAELVPCSRSQAEQYIEGGWVRVDGEVVETPQARVLDQRIEIDPQARLAPLEPVTLLLHKPPGFDAGEGRRPALQLLGTASQVAQDRSGIRPLRRHFLQLQCVTPLETGAAGLVVFTQEWRVARKLTEDAALVEQELIVEVAGPFTPEALARLNQAPVVGGRAMLPAKVSLNQQTPQGTRLRFALKGNHPGQIARMCDGVGLQVTGMKRIRIGRLPLAGLPEGQWRYLAAHERF